MFQRFLMKKMLSSQLKGVPEDQQNMILDMIEKNPELFKKIAEEIKERVNKGEDQMAATQAVMMNYQSELKDALGK